MQASQQDCIHYVCSVEGVEESALDPSTYGTKEDPNYNGPPAQTFPFLLDDFQKLSISCIERKESVLVAAHTSAGKTAVAEYACAVCLRDRQKIVYTAPIKALSNQKYREFESKFNEQGEGTVGLMTGDVTIHPHAPIIVMTTEILRSMLYRASEMLDEIAWVVFDEVHYMQDRERGVVWEETIIILPHEIRMVFLSATLPNSKEFAEWIAHLHFQPCHVVYTEKRPVPLKHYGYVQGGDLMLTLVDSKTGAFKPEVFDELMSKFKRNKDGNQKSRGIEEDERGRWKKEGPFSSRSDDLCKMVHLFQTKDFLPVIIFCFGKRLAEQNASHIVDVLDLTNNEEKEQIDYLFDKAIGGLSSSDRSLPVLDNVRGIVRRGVGIHHSGMLPLLKEVTEILFQESFIKVLCATETFAMGLNMPARTVLFTSLKKYDGIENRTILPSEYIQMSGRAGRRGKDKRGYVVVMLDESVKKEEYKELLMGKVTPLQSSFRLSYYTLLNLLQKVEGTQQSIDEIIRKSFNQFQHTKGVPDQKTKLESLERRADALKIEKTLLKQWKRKNEIDQEAQTLTRELNAAKLDHMQALQMWTPGRMIKVQNCGIGIVLCPQSYHSGDPYYLNVMLPCITPDSKIEIVDISKPDHPSERLFLEVFPVFLRDVEEVFKTTLYVPEDVTIEAEKASLLQQLRNLLSQFDGQLPVCEWIKDIDVHDVSILEKIEQLEKLEKERILQPRTEMDVDLQPQIEEKIQIMVEIDQVKKEMENTMMLSFQEEYRSRVNVLKKLGHINEDGVLTLKGKAACEIDAGDELMCAELLFDGVLKRIDRNYLVAFLSCLIPFSDRSEERSKALEYVQNHFETLRRFAKRIADVSEACKVEIDTMEYVESFHPSFIDIMHAWETGSTFMQVTKMSDIFEGVIIRSARRLAELIQQLTCAARVMGDAELVKRLEESNTRLKRDIMFAASLYV